MGDPLDAVIERSIALATTWEECRTWFERSNGIEMLPRLEKMARVAKYSQWFAEFDAKKFNEWKLSATSGKWRKHFLDFLKFHLRNPSETIDALDGLFVEASGGTDGLPSPVVSIQRKFSVDLIAGRIAVLGPNPETHFERGFERWVRENFSIDEQPEPIVNIEVDVQSNSIWIEVSATVQLF
jgi:hypothetical protein